MYRACTLVLLLAVLHAASGAMTVTTVPATGVAVETTIAAGLNITISVTNAVKTGTATYTCIVVWSNVTTYGGSWGTTKTLTATLVTSGTTDKWFAHLSPTLVSKYEFYAKCTDTSGASVYSTTIGNNGRFSVVSGAKCGDWNVDTSRGEQCDVGDELVLYCGSNCTCQAGYSARNNARGCWNASAALPTSGRNLWRSRTVYQIITDRFSRGNDSTATGACNLTANVYCGGTFRGIVDKLDYITGMGFDAILISPVVSNLPGKFHGYSASNLSEINPHFGGSDGLHELINECHKRDVLVMIDWVSNHMGAFTNYSSIYPFNLASHYHSCTSCPSGCNIADYTDQLQVENCRLSGLMDLNQTVPFVRQQLSFWANNLVANFSADGFRLDTVKHIAIDYWRQFRSDVNIFMMGEVYDSTVAAVATYQQPLDSLLWYPMFYTLNNVFASGQNVSQIQTQIATSRKAFVDTTVLGTFLDNQDQPRFLNQNSDRVLLSNALAALLLGEGIPFVYYGTEQYLHGGSDPQDREALWETGFTGTDMYKHIAELNAVRKAAEVWNFTQVTLLAKDSVYAFSRGPIIGFLRNSGNTSAQITVSFNSSLVTPGIYYSIFNSSFSLTVASGNYVTVTLPSGGMPVVLSSVVPKTTTSSSSVVIPAVYSSLTEESSATSAVDSSSNQIDATLSSSSFEHSSIKSEISSSSVQQLSSDVSFPVVSSEKMSSLVQSSMSGYSSDLQSSSPLTPSSEQVPSAHSSYQASSSLLPISSAFASSSTEVSSLKNIDSSSKLIPQSSDSRESALESSLSSKSSPLSESGVSSYSYSSEKPDISSVLLNSEQSSSNLASSSSVFSRSVNAASSSSLYAPSSHSSVDQYSSGSIQDKSLSSIVKHSSTELEFSSSEVFSQQPLPSDFSSSHVESESSIAAAGPLSSSKNPSSASNARSDGSSDETHRSSSAKEQHSIQFTSSDPSDSTAEMPESSHMGFTVSSDKLHGTSSSSSLNLLSSSKNVFLSSLSSDEDSDGSSSAPDSSFLSQASQVLHSNDDIIAFATTSQPLWILLLLTVALTLFEF